MNKIDITVRMGKVKYRPELNYFRFVFSIKFQNKVGAKRQIRNYNLREKGQNNYFTIEQRRYERGH